MPNYDADARQYAPATQRNRRPILAVLQQHLPNTGVVLEIASGTGEHACFWAQHLGSIQWLPTDINPVSLQSIVAWQNQTRHQMQNQTRLDNLYSPIFLDATAPQWPIEVNPLPESLEQAGFQVGMIQAIATINMIHIAPWSACEGLMAGAGRILPSGGILYLYGPFKQGGTHTAPSNAAFDDSLRSRNSNWGVRNLEDVTALANHHGLRVKDIIPMPANNLSVIFQK